MSDQDDNDEQQDPEQVPPRQPTEGVRILGAQEAAEATGRHDVVRRRDRGAKRHGDRPDPPRSDEDLPRITISTTEAQGGPDQFGPVPIVPPQGSSVTPPPEEQPRWSEEGRESFGHARLTDQPLSSGPPAAGPPAAEPPAAEPPVVPPVDEPLEDDEAFVLPHWTEPPTGQVPKVVIDAPDEPLATAGGQPRWMDSGERGHGGGFDDLMDDAPSYGALGNDDRELEDADLGFFDRERDPGEDTLAGFTAPSPRERRRAASEGEGRGAGPGGPPRGPGGDRNLPLAVAVGVGIAALGLLCFALGTWTTMLLAVAVVGVAAFEYFSAVRSVGYNPATLLGLVAVAALVVGTTVGGLAAYPVVFGITIMAGLLWFLWIAPGEGSVANLGLTLLGVMWIGLLGSFAGLFLGLGRIAQDAAGEETNRGIGVLIAAVIVSVSYDVGGYFIGRQFGNTPLSSASPNKTLEGLFGGVGAAVVVTIIVVQFIGIAPIGGELGRTMVFALLCAIAAPAGDLAESFVKRDLGLKDMGSALPAHGGVLDRFDSLLFVLPTAYFVTVLLGTWS